MKVVDLCSGLGGFSEAFVKRGHDVVRIDNDERFRDVPCTKIADVKEITRGRFFCLNSRSQPGYGRYGWEDIDIVLASPPCTVFSVASLSKYWDDHIPKIWETVKGIRTVMWCLDAIDVLDPKWWIIENPRGMLRHVLGMPKVTTYFASWGSLSYKPTDLWGELPPGIKFPEPENWEKIPRGMQNRSKMAGGRDPAIKAKIPYPLSEAICIACEEALKC